jgi:hypothetical protein
VHGVVGVPRVGGFVVCVDVEVGNGWGSVRNHVVAVVFSGSGKVMVILWVGVEFAGVVVDGVVFSAIVAAVGGVEGFSSS